jgi:hypothetical protein
MQSDNDGGGFFARLFSRVLLIVGLLWMAFLCWHFPADRRVKVQTFKDFKVDLPELTVKVIEIPDAAFPVAGLAVAVCMIAVQVGARGNTAAVFHLAVIVLGLVLYDIYRDAMIQPALSLIESISGPGRR